MNYLIIILFWIIILGYKKLVEIKIDSKISLVVTFALLTLVLFISGILNILYISSILIYIIGLLLFIYYFKDIIKEFKVLNINKFINIIMFIIITIISINSHIVLYDNFSHWALIVKDMFISNSLPNMDSIIFFKSYQPGGALFIYLFGFLSDHKDSMMILANNYLIFSFITVFINFSKNNLNRVLSILYYIFVILCSKCSFNSLYVDNILNLSFTISLLLIYINKKDIRKVFLPIFIISIFMAIIKNMGIGFGLLNVIILIYISIKNNKFDINIKYILYILLGIIFISIIWYLHVYLVFGLDGLVSKHSLLSASSNNLDYIFVIIKEYFKCFISGRNISLYIMIILNIYYLVIKNKIIIKIDILYIVFTMALLLMYIFMMPYSESIYVAEFERYIMSIFIPIIGFLVYYNYDNKNINILFISLLIILSISNINNLFINRYKDSLVEKYDIILDGIYLEKNNSYYIITDYIDMDGYLYYLSIYKLNSLDIKIRNGIENIDEVSGYIIDLDMKKLDYNLDKISEFIYYKNR